MRTRSEWFLGPQDGDILCVPSNTCNNCCLSAANFQSSGYYLGGGSTRDMRGINLPTNGSSTSTEKQVNETVNTYLCNNMYQQQPPPPQRQSFHVFPEHMDTDESFTSYGAGNRLNKQTTTFNSMQHKLFTSNQSAQALSTRQAEKEQGLLLDTYYGRYDFDDKDILTENSNDSYNLTYNINTNNNKHKHITENNHSYTISNRPHLRKTTLPALNSSATSKETNLYVPRSLSSSLCHLHATSTPQHYHRSPNISHFYSSEYLPHSNKFINVDDEDDTDEEGHCCSSSHVPAKLSYQSSRQQQSDEQHIHLLRYHSISDEMSSLKATDANIITTIKTTTPAIPTADDCLKKDLEEVDHIPTSNYRHSTPMLQRRRLRQQALRRQRLLSTSSSLYQSFNASLQAPMSSAGHFIADTVQNSLNSDTNLETHSSSAVSNSGGSNSNFVNIIFNVLDFLF